MLKSTLFRRLFLPNLLLICAAIGAVGVFEASHLRGTHLDQTTQRLRDDARLVAQLVKSNLAPGREADLNRQVRELGQAIGCRVTVVADDGRVLADTEADPAGMDNHGGRPEVVGAAGGGEGSSIRPSNTVHEDMLYFARRAAAADGSPRYIRLAVHLRELERHLRVLYAGLATAAVLAMLGAGAICFYFARRHSEPLVELTEFAQSLAGGNLGRRVLRAGTGEVGTLGAALNTMADSLTGLLDQTARDKAQLLAIVSSMSEGVVATDARRRVLFSNAAAASLLGLPADAIRGRFLWEVVRNEPILRAADEVLAGHEDKHLRVSPAAGRYVEVTLSTFRSAESADGLVVVARDTTQSVRYETLRKEFVANVSHELRTPVTVIRGFAETLRDGALHDPVRGPQYLAAIERHADQLANLVNDLLELSRLEVHPALPRCVSVELGPVIRQAVELLQPLADKKNQTLTTDLPADLPPLPGDPDYLERAVANLVENAVKYTPAGGRVAVSAAADATHVRIEVTDTGIGIPEADLPRIFERFYRVDRSRSREMGGTGLGLSIVKHVAQAHRGTVEVTSTPGAGTTFRLKLPLVVTDQPPA